MRAGNTQYDPILTLALGVKSRNLFKSVKLLKGGLRCLMRLMMR